MNVAPSPVALAEVLARGDVWRGDTLASLPAAAIPSGHAELDARAGLEGREAVGQRRLVDEDLAAVVPAEEPESLVGVEPLDLARGHGTPHASCMGIA